MSKRVYIVEEDCMGCGRCETTCPEVFKIDEDNDISKVILPEGSPADAIQAAIGHCQGLGYVNGVAKKETLEALGLSAIVPEMQIRGLLGKE